MELESCRQTQKERNRIMRGRQYRFGTAAAPPRNSCPWHAACSLPANLVRPLHSGHASRQSQEAPYAHIASASSGGGARGSGNRAVHPAPPPEEAEEIGR